MNNWENILFPIYVAVGPVAWVLFALGLHLGRVRMARLRRPPMPVPQPPPRVTVLVPAKDEETAVGSCLESVLKQDYPFFSVIAINDRSVDKTGKIMDGFAQRDDRLRVLHIQPGTLPAGWLGKCNALSRAAENADGQWLLFVDSDVTLTPDVLRSTLALAETRGYDAISLLTRLECHTIWERLILPLAAGAWSVMHTISLTNSDTRKHIALANGQFILVRRTVYEAVGGHESVKDLITEDVELMRRIKAKDFKTRFFMGRDFAATRMYSELGPMFHGWARIFSGTTRRRPWRILGAIAFIVLCGLSVYPAMAWGIYRLHDPGTGPHTWGWIANAGVHFALLTVCVAIIYRWSGIARRWALVFPAGAIALLSILSFALVKCMTGRTNWRGTTYEPRVLDADLITSKT